MATTRQLKAGGRMLVSEMADVKMRLVSDMAEVKMRLAALEDAVAVTSRILDEMTKVDRPAKTKTGK